MDKGQHLRLFLRDTLLDSGKVIAMATELRLHGSVQTENSTTKDTTDASGVVWDEYEPQTRSVDITFGALIAAGTDTAAKTFADILDGVSDTLINWEIAFATGANNRSKGDTICTGQGKITNIQATGQVGQNATYSGTINVWGNMTPGRGPVSPAGTGG